MPRVAKEVDKDQVISMYLKSTAKHIIADVLGIGSKRVSEIINDAGVSRTKKEDFENQFDKGGRKGNPLPPDEVRRMREEGASLRSIAERFRVDTDRVRKILGEETVNSAEIGQKTKSIQPVTFLELQAMYKDLEVGDTLEINISSIGIRKAVVKEKYTYNFRVEYESGVLESFSVNDLMAKKYIYIKKLA